jgi:diguanylate cyclase (GGDEF)-like protein
MSLVILKNEQLERRRPASHAPATATVAKLRSENAALRREIDRLHQYRELAFRDPLTGLLNRRSFHERLGEECARVRRGGTYRFAVILIDVDDFKAVNDTLGHATGDEVLRATARLLEHDTREVDLCYRIGGDEFAIILPDTDPTGAESVLERLRQAVDPAWYALPVPVGLSMGVAAAPPTDPDPDAVVAAADAEMYRDKARRKEG